MTRFDTKNKDVSVVVRAARLHLGACRRAARTTRRGGVAKCRLLCRTRKKFLAAQAVAGLGRGVQECLQMSHQKMFERNSAPLPGWPTPGPRTPTGGLT